MSIKKTVLSILYALILSLGSAGAIPVSASQLSIETETLGAGTSVELSQIPAEKEEVELSLSYGYQNTAKPRRLLPVRMTIKNNRDTALTGRVELYMIESSDMVYCYEYPVSVEASGEQKISGNISIGENVGELLAVLKNDSGATLREETVRLNIDSSGPALFIGIISDDPTSLNFMSGVSLNNTALKARTLFLNADELPTTEEGLDQLDVIVISNYNVNLLDDEVISVIWDWVENGGILLLGTGARHNPIGDFMEYLPETIIGSPEIRPVNMGIRYSTEGLEGAILNIPVSDVYIDGGIQKLTSDDVAVLTTVKVGAGTVGITAYDLCDISEFCKEQISYTDELLTSLIGSAGIGRLSKTMESGRDEYSEISRLINVGNVDSFPNLTLYLLAALAYVLLAGPGLYIFLKQRGLSHIYGLGVIGASVTASALIWFMGMGTRLDGPFINFASIREISPEGESETDFIGIASPYNSSVRIGLDTSYTVRPIIGADESGKSLSGAVTDNTLKRITVDYGKDMTYVETQNMKPFTEAVFELNKSEKNTDENPISSELYIFDRRVEGSISNNSEENLKNVTLLLYGGVLKIGDIGAGESRRITGGEISFAPTGMPYIIGNYVMGVDDDSRSSDREYMSDLSGSGLIEYYMENSLGDYYGGAKLIAFSENEDAPGSLSDSGTDCYGTTLIAMDAGAGFEHNGEVYRVALSEEPKLISGEYNVYDNTTGGNAAVILEYFLGTDVNITGLEFNSLSEEFEGMRDRDQNALYAFDGDIALYNYYTSSYDNMESGKMSFDADELTAYLSPGNSITVRYIPKESTSSDAAVFLPIPAITGEKL